MVIKDYYSRKLSANLLKKCYDIATPRIQQYLAAEVDFVLQKVKKTDRVLELGCGYGRVLEKLADSVKTLVGIDMSTDNLLIAREKFSDRNNVKLFQMNAVNLDLKDDEFNLVFCIQNGISAFKVDQLQLLTEAVRVTRKGGLVLFSSYSEKFWDDRLEWFRLQSTYGLIGKIDESLTGNGVIVCQDGFTATTVSVEEFSALAANLNVVTKITEVDSSSMFCKMLVR